MKLKIKPFQDKFIYSKSRYPAFVSAWATGKSMCGIIRAMAASKTYNQNMGVIFRKEFTDLRDSTIKDFETYTGLKVDSAREVTLQNGSVIMFRHLEEINNIQNVNLGWFWIEQGEEIETEDPFFMLMGRLRRADVPHWGALTANTKGHNWIHRLFKLGELKDSELVEAVTFDNADVLPPDYIESLEQIKIQRPRIYNRFVLNSWEEDDASDLVMSRSIVEACAPPIFPFADAFERRVTVADIASFGDDETVIYDMVNSKIVDQEIYCHRDLMDTVGRIIAHAKKNHSVGIAVDKIGEGSGVHSRLCEIFNEDSECKVYGFDSRIEPPTEDNQTYGNYRAYAWFKAANKYFKERQAWIPKDEKLITQLSSIKYRFKSNGRIFLESKEEIKKRLGWSPDRADAYVMGLDTIEKVKPVLIGSTQKKVRGYAPDRFREGAKVSWGYV